MTHMRKSVFVLVLVALLIPAQALLAQATLGVQNNKVGIGEAAGAPAELLHVKGVGARLLLQESSGSTAERVVMNIANRGPARMNISDSVSGASWAFKTAGPSIPFFDISKDGTGVSEMRIDATTGNVTIQGNIISNNCPSGCGPDYVFEPDYELMPLSELAAFVSDNRHLPNVPPAADMAENGVNVTQLSLRLLEKVEELTLHTIAQQNLMEVQQETIQRLIAQVGQLSR